MRAYVELPQGWGPAQMIITAWLRAGYHVEEHRSIATGTRYLVIGGDAGAGDHRAVSASWSDHAPRMCPYGHELRPGHVLVGWSPCMCPPAWERHGGHRTYSCEDCRERYGISMICYLPEHSTAHHLTRGGEAPPS
jgi:hypothetical protein